MSLTKEELIEAFIYLDELRESGRTNMWGAAHYLETEHNMDPEVSGLTLTRWMDTFSHSEGKTPEQRTGEALGEKAP